jgi:hypothetical protein
MRSLRLNSPVNSSRTSETSSLTNLLKSSLTKLHVRFEVFNLNETPKLGKVAEDAGATTAQAAIPASGSGVGRGVVRNEFVMSSALALRPFLRRLFLLTDSLAK